MIGQEAVIKCPETSLVAMRNHCLLLSILQ
jgi:hypothetical protein